MQNPLNLVQAMSLAKAFVKISQLDRETITLQESAWRNIDAADSISTATLDSLTLRAVLENATPFIEKLSQLPN